MELFYLHDEDTEDEEPSLVLSSGTTIQRTRPRGGFLLLVSPHFRDRSHLRPTVCF